MTEMLRTRVGHAFRRMAVPLVAYYTVTLVLPLANGAAQAGAAFVKHAIVVLVVPTVAIVAGCAVHAIARRSVKVTAVEARRPRARTNPSAPIQMQVDILPCVRARMLAGRYQLRAERCIEDNDQMRL